MDKRRINRLVNLSLVLPIIILLLSLVSYFYTDSKYGDYSVTYGTIVDFHVEEDKTYVNKDTRFKLIPTIEYNVNGQLYIHDCDYYSSSMKKGDEIEILYNSDNPNEFVLKKGLRIFPIILAIVGIIMLFLNLLIRAVARKIGDVIKQQLSNIH